MPIDKSHLFAPRLDKAEVEIPGIGTIIVRGLSRAEISEARRKTSDDPLQLERTYLSTAMLEPLLTEAEVGQWQAASPLWEIQAVVTKIMELSGMDEGAQKRAYQEFRNQPGS